MICQNTKSMKSISKTEGLLTLRTYLAKNIPANLETTKLQQRKTMNILKLRISRLLFGGSGK